jgi:hypothetical protein
MKKINDNTVVRVRVPKKLYEAIQKKMKLKEGDDMSPSTSVTASNTSDLSTGEVTEGSIPPDVQEAIQQVATFVKDNWGMLGTAIAMIAGAKAAASKITKDKTNIDAITGANH